IPLTTEQAELKMKMLSEVGKEDFRAVSFRLTGTLVLTPFSEFEDMFMLMEEDFRALTTVRKPFRELRVAAAGAAEKKYCNSGGATIARIYDILAKTGRLSPLGREKLLKRECELAVHFAFARGFGKELFDRAKSTKKKIIIVADTIYPRSTVARILESCGYSDADELVVPSELKGSVTDHKAVYDAVLKKAGVSAGKLLHIGGDVAADVETPIMNGSKALLLSDTVPLMVKSGRLRGFVQAKHVYDYDEPEYLALHGMFGVYAAYLFDVPINKTPQSDFCGSPYMLGFIAGGPVSAADIVPKDKTEKRLLEALSGIPEAAAGMEDMDRLFHMHFDGHISKSGYKDCGMPLGFLARYSAPGDRAMLQGRLDPAFFAEWTEGTKEPKLAPVHARTVKRSFTAKLADRLFPPGTKVRNIADGMLVKMKSRKK
ncbi:MAG: hypothetical protein II784_00815, partial [Oscillospiraceae bacterium]|nr:hypothetical protein [Oscillospiraceae bacterium]